MDFGGKALSGFEEESLLEAKVFSDLEELGRLSCGASISNMADLRWVDSPRRRVAGMAIMGVDMGPSEFPIGVATCEAPFPPFPDMDSLVERSSFICCDWKKEAGSTVSSPDSSSLLSWRLLMITKQVLQTLRLPWTPKRSPDMMDVHLESNIQPHVRQ